MEHRRGGGGSHRRPQGGRGKPPGRRTPPPDATGAEADFLLKSKEGGTRLVFRLIDGETLSGKIEYYDRDMIKVYRKDGPNLFVRKEHIRYIEEHGDEDP